jgi:beta-galactosidase
MKRMPRVRALIALVASSGACCLCAGSDAPRERISFNADWRFAKDDPAGTGDALAFSKIEPWLLPTGGELLNAAAAKPVRPEGNPGSSVAYAQPGFDDSRWRKLELPHDWGIEGPFRQEYPGETAKLPWWGVGWYRKHFTMPIGDRTKNVYLDVDGAMSHAAVWLNGRIVGGWGYGYTSWRVDLTPYLVFGGENVISIRLDNPPDSSRWYPGGGIYRNVWLVKTSPVHVAHWGTFIRTPVVSSERALVDVQVTVQNDTTEEVKADVDTAIYVLDGSGRRVGDPIALVPPVVGAKVASGRQAQVGRTVFISQPQLWSPRAPNRYFAVSNVHVAGRLVDRYETEFGIRTVEFTADQGLLVNGERVRIQGVCDHHDLGALGTALNVRALERQLELLREMGCNAIRTSHNPPAPELLELADRMGFLVMDEAFDSWIAERKRNDYHLLFPTWHEQDLRALIRRDRNHPSIILWSVGNEVVEQNRPEGWKLASHLAAIVREEDRTRDVTTACEVVASGYNGFQDVVSVFGYNYKPGEYPKLHASHPQLPLFGSETSSTLSSRGEYFFPLSKDKAEGACDFQVSSYDLMAPPWATRAEDEFRGQDQASYVAGEFVWTGFDYLGEPTPYFSDTKYPANFSDPSRRALAEAKKLPIPSRSSYFGMLDLAGFKKDRFFLYQARWRPDLPMAHILPHWTWPERAGQPTPVHVYTSGDEAELFLNGRSLGRKSRGPLEYRLRWDDVAYEPGELRVVAYRHGAKWAEDTMRTAGTATAVRLTADRQMIRADRADLAFVTAAIVDAAGTLAPRAANKIAFEVSGPADVIATDNGDPTSFESFQSRQRAAFHGLALALVRTRAGQTGTVTIRAVSAGLASAETVIEVK